MQFETQEAAQKACQLHGSDFMGRELTVDVATAADSNKVHTGTPVEGCWFCLSNPNADVNLVASIGGPCLLASLYAQEMVLPESISTIILCRQYKMCVLLEDSYSSSGAASGWTVS